MSARQNQTPMHAERKLGGDRLKKSLGVRPDQRPVRSLDFQLFTIIPLSMKNQERLKLFTIIGIVFFVIYLFIAARPLNTELQIKAEWSVNLDSLTTENYESSLKTEKLQFPFRLMNKTGYFTEDGKILFVQDFPYKATISPEYWTTFEENASKTIIFDKNKAEVGLIPSSGFPFFQDDRCYLFAPGGNAVSQYSIDGKRLWIYEGYCPITAFNSSAKGAVLGFADGNLVHLKPDGTSSFSMYPGGSNYEVILGADIAPEASLAACVCGLDKQRFVLLHVADRQTKVLFHTYLEGDMKEQTLVKFSDAGDLVYFNYDGGLGIVDIISKKISYIPIEGKIISIAEIPEKKMVFILSHRGSHYDVHVLEKNDNLIGSFSFKAANAFIETGKHTLFVGRDNTISSLSISRR